jgi:hypothetical protein
MSDILNTRISDEFFILFGMGIGLVAVVGTFVVLFSLISAIHRRRSQLDDMEATLKMEMIERGMTAEDIERVLRARMGNSDRKSLTMLFDAAAASRSRKWNQPAQPS